MEFFSRRFAELPRAARLGLPLVTALVGVQLIRSVNRLMSQRALNHGVTNPKWNPNKEIVLVTGGSSGLGAALVSRLAKRSAVVLNLDVNKPKMLQPENVHFYLVDVTDATQIANVAVKIRAEHGHPTVLINNAGIAGLGLILEKSAEATRRLIEINLLAHFFTIKEFVPDMAKKNHGHVVAVASLSSFLSAPCVIDYSAAKAGVVALQEGLSTELALYHNAPRVRTTWVLQTQPTPSEWRTDDSRVVHPGWMRTSMISVMDESSKFHKDAVEPDVLAAEIEQAVVGGNAAQIIVPRNLWIFSGMRGWPHWMQRTILMGMGRELMPVMAPAIGRG